MPSARSHSWGGSLRYFLGLGVVLATGERFWATPNPGNLGEFSLLATADCAMAQRWRPYYEFLVAVPRAWQVSRSPLRDRPRASAARCCPTRTAEPGALRAP